MFRIPRIVSHLVVLAAAAACATEEESDPSRPSAGSVCPTGFLGDPAREPLIELRSLAPDGTDVPLVDGGDFKCLADVEVSCKAQCTKPSGGIFCNGQFVNATDVQQCVAYLSSKLSIDVDVSATASAACTGDGCGAEGKASVGAGGCATSPGKENGLAGVFGLGGVFAIASVLRARRKARQTR